jgi:L-seryl-tRNA(Ser) seleniumtransferase
MTTGPADLQAALRQLPAVDEALRLARIAQLAARTGRVEATRLVRGALDGLRRELREGQLDPAALAERVGAEAVADRVEALFLEERRRGLHPCVNVTGVVNTGLGRAPVHPEAAALMGAVAGGYGILEVDRATGKRNRRDDQLSRLLSRLVGCEAAIAVNNNAAATYLCLNTFARGGEAIVSRGELVEIGGSFRVPDVMTQAGVTLREVGTTNRTRIEDYRAAVNERTRLLMKVHTSNFRVVGFTEEVPMGELAALGREVSLPTVFDLGSGLVEAEGLAPLPDLGGETRVADAVASGLDVVTFSGDKLLGGPQAGLLVGRREAILALRSNPVYRAMRLDKTALAGLEVTLSLLLDGRGDELPTRRMLRAGAEELRPVAERIAAHLDALPGLAAEVRPDRSQPGSGSAPDVFLDTWSVRVTSAHLSAEGLARRLRLGEPPVFTRLHDGAVHLDPRTLLEGDEARLLAAFEALAGDE